MTWPKLLVVLLVYTLVKGCELVVLDDTRRALEASRGYLWDIKQTFGYIHTLLLSKAKKRKK